jgi:hypothetical protein
MTALPRTTAPSVVLADIKTMADCDATLDAMQIFIAQGERRLSAAPRRSPNQPAGWRVDLEAELRLARMMLPRLQERRGDLKREERQQRHLDGLCGMGRTSGERAKFILLDLAWSTEPDAMMRVEALARERHPGLFPAKGEAA